MFDGDSSLVLVFALRCWCCFVLRAGFAAVGAGAGAGYWATALDLLREAAVALVPLPMIWLLVLLVDFEVDRVINE